MTTFQIFLLHFATTLSYKEKICSYSARFSGAVSMCGQVRLHLFLCISTEGHALFAS